MSLSLLLWLLLGGVIGLVEWPYQLLSELGFQLQHRLWPLPGLAIRQPGWSASLQPLIGPSLVFAATAAVLALARGALAAGKGGGVAPLLALDRADAVSDKAVEEGALETRERHWLEALSLRSQLQRLLLILVTHLGGLAVGIESPSVALGASVLLALRRRWGQESLLGHLPLPLVAVAGGAAGLGAAFRSPLLGVIYGLEELGRRSGLPLVLPALLMAGSGSLVAGGLGQPARLGGMILGPLPLALLPWVIPITVVGSLLGGLLVRSLLVLAPLLKTQMDARPAQLILLLSATMTLLAIVSGGLSLNDGSLSLAAALQGQSGGDPITLLWRFLATVLSVACGAPGGLMHDAMSLGGLLVSPLIRLTDLNAAALAQLGAVGATAVFAGANGTPIFCAAFVCTLQGDAGRLPLLLLVSAISDVLASGLRGEGWNDAQTQALLKGPC